MDEKSCIYSLMNNKFEEKNWRDRVSRNVINRKDSISDLQATPESIIKKRERQRQIYEKTSPYSDAC